jgi:hypothetical protein
VAALAGDHARNAGPTLYYLDFSANARLSLLPTSSGVVTVPVSSIRRDPAGWLLENTLTMVARN